MIETPAYFASKGDMDNSEKILNEISKKNTKKEFKFSDLKETNKLSFDEENSEKKTIKFILNKLFHKPALKVTVLAGLV